MILSDFDGYQFELDMSSFNGIMFLSFVLFITIILFILLNVLAISETQQIMKSAEIVDLKKRG